MKRAKHTLSHYRMITSNMGECIPIGCVPVLPGDTVQHHTSALVRVSPLNTPVMHPVNVRIHHFYCPNRIIDPTWEDFITGGNDGLGASLPTLNTTNDKKSVLTYLGLPPIGGVDVLALPVYAFNKIVNEYYADQDLQTQRAEDDITIPKIAWEKDYFTTARPWTQRGPDVTLPLGSRADLATDIAGAQAIRANDAGGDPFQLDTSGATLTRSATPGTEQGLMYADLTTAGAINVNDFRAAFSLQRYQEARARYGARFTEYLRYLGVTPSDARLQRPEFLGGGVSRVNFSEVLQTTPSSAAFDDSTTFNAGVGVGDLYGHGIAGVRGNSYRKFFEEHGYIISIMSVRPKSLYLNGIPRDWLKRTKEDYYQKELTNLGQQEIFNNEVAATEDAGGDSVFGYQDRYHEYRSHPSQVGQDFRDVLNAYHLGRDLPAGTSLNESFIECDPSRRIFQVTDDELDTLWTMANHHMVARRLVPKRANPRIL